MQALAVEIEKRERQQQVLAGELARLERLAQLQAVGLQRIDADLRERLRDRRNLMRRNVGCGRQILMRLLSGKIRWTPHKETRTYELAATITLGKVLSEFTEVLASPTGTNPDVIAGRLRVA